MKNKRTKQMKLGLIFPCFFMLLFFSCYKKAGPVPSCGIQLFDGENYKDNFVSLEGSGSYTNLKNLPNTDEDWTKEADAVKVGKNSTVTFWTGENYQGDSLVLQPGKELAKLNFKMQSMRIECH